MNLEVIYQGKPVLRLNRILVDRQKLTDKDIEEIKRLHVSRLETEDKMRETSDKSELKRLFAIWTVLQYSLQKSWGFKEDSKVHKFWEVPKCTCAKLDNDDRWPIGMYVYNQSCPVHGS